MTAPLSVVIVDDDSAIAALHERFVAAHPGFEVREVAGDGPSAVAAIQAHHPDVVLLDFHLPGFSGLDVLRAVRATAGPQPDFIAVTAVRDVESVRAARAAGVHHYLVKPFSATALRNRLDEVAHDRRLFEGAAGLHQDEIDVLFTSGARAQALPKGLSTETLASVQGALRPDADASATEVSVAVGISRVSARRYLEHLVASGRAARTLRYSTGRPSSVYTLVE
ncbi:response regulator [Rathayibacter sp. ZW T2_19]|uniref:Transcriptional regulatory protein n=1 Tax=Rathayibacter rubneri TaxID=2950106 RepID=A0A9X2DY73_9MICO|nr:MULTISPECIES: response regulator [Rathayibacter]MCM6763367.1 response regulator [Rathayibacter rubneri]